jgi:hypothetical protein
MEWPSLATILKPFNGVNSLPITQSRLCAGWAREALKSEFLSDGFSVID